MFSIYSFVSHHVQTAAVSLKFHKLSPYMCVIRNIMLDAGSPYTQREFQGSMENCLVISLVRSSSFDSCFLSHLKHVCVWVYWKIVSQTENFSSFSPTQTNEDCSSVQSFPLRQLRECVRVEKRHRKDKTGKFVSANLDFGVTRRFSIVICAPPVKAFSFISFLTVKKKRREWRRKEKFLFCTHFNK